MTEVMFTLTSKVGFVPVYKDYLRFTGWCLGGLVHHRRHSDQNIQYIKYNIIDRISHTRVTLYNSLEQT